MTGKMSRNLVVDANIAKAAGQAVHPISSSCRSVLEEIRRVCHHVVMDNRLSKEWKKHQSMYAKMWLASMISKRKVNRIPSGDLPSLAMEIEESDIATHHIRAAKKDIHIVELALKTDRLILSMDERAKLAFSEVARTSRKIRKLNWVNPIDDNVISWIREGARSSSEYELFQG